MLEIAKQKREIDNLYSHSPMINKKVIPMIINSLKSIQILKRKYKKEREEKEKQKIQREHPKHHFDYKDMLNQDIISEFKNRFWGI